METEKEQIERRKQRGSLIASIRREKGITIADMAKQIGVSPNTITKIEHGYLHPRINHIEAIANILDIDKSIIVDIKVS